MNKVEHFELFREDPALRKSAVQMEFCQIAFQTPCGFEYGNGYFDNASGQTLFFDGILTDIMVDKSEI